MSQVIPIRERELLHVRIDELTEALVLVTNEVANISKLLLLLLQRGSND